MQSNATQGLSIIGMPRTILPHHQPLILFALHLFCWCCSSSQWGEILSQGAVPKLQYIEIFIFSVARRRHMPSLHTIVACHRGMPSWHAVVACRCRCNRRMLSHAIVVCCRRILAIVTCCICMMQVVVVAACRCMPLSHAIDVCHHHMLLLHTVVACRHRILCDSFLEVCLNVWMLLQKWVNTISLLILLLLAN